MNKLIQIIFSLLFLLSMVACNPKQSISDTTIKIMSYNIHIASPPSTKPAFTYFDLDAIADVIKRENPDLVALQEVDRYTIRSGKEIHQAAELARMTNMQYFFAPAEKKSDGYQGVAILSKYPTIKTISTKLPTLLGSTGETRSLAGIIVSIQGEDVLFLCTHIDHISVEDRKYQVEQIMEDISEFKDYPIIFAGDFNSEIHKPEDQIYPLLSNDFQMVDKSNPPLTFPEINPRVAIDHILLNRKSIEIFDIKGYYTIDERYASDHLPLILELQFKIN